MQLLNRSLSTGQLSQLLGEASLEELMALVSARHAVHFEDVRVGADVIQCLQVTDMAAYIDQQIERPDQKKGMDLLPLWAKIWPASLPLIMYMQHLTPEPGQRILEIGAGLGLVGLFAAKRGFPVVITDNAPEALLFARINALRNELGEAVQVMSADFVHNNHQGVYSHILGSEVLYREKFFEPLLNFLLAHLEPGGQSEILLTADAGRRSLKFFAAAKNHFRMQRTVIPYNPDNSHVNEAVGSAREQTIHLYRMKPL